MATSGALSGYTSLAEPDLLFATNKKHKHPLLGLISHGPYGLKFGTPSTLRLAALAPKRDMNKLSGLIAELGVVAKSREAKNYYPEFPGFKQTLPGPHRRTGSAASHRISRRTRRACPAS